jgi:RNA polymerase sigma-70 factor (ECF subfamily)
MSPVSVRAEEFERVAMPHAQSLLRVALRLTQDAGAAEDLAQETLLQGWRAFDQFVRDTNCKAWLFRILLNLSSKRRRKLGTRPPLVSLDGQESSNVVSLRVEAPQCKAVEVFGALDALPEEHRVMLMLAIVEGFTCKEIAQMQDVPIGTVMSRLSRARTGLRHILTNQQGGGKASEASAG